MGFCISIRIEELDLVKMKLKHLGIMHKSIIHHPYLFGIYASNIHSTIRHCLGENAHHEVMSAWLHLLAFILRGMLPSYFAGLTFAGHFSGAVNATSTINDKARDEVRNTEDMRVLKTKLQSLNNTEPPSRWGGDREKNSGDREVYTGRSQTQTQIDVNPLDRPLAFEGRQPLQAPIIEQIRRGEKMASMPSSPSISGQGSAYQLPGSTATVTKRIPEDE